MTYLVSGHWSRRQCVMTVWNENKFGAMEKTQERQK